jgi:hypothetical protein
MDILTIASGAEGPMIMGLLKACDAVKPDPYGTIVCGKSYYKFTILPPL